jgi:hypothetical protein
MYLNLISGKIVRKNGGLAFSSKIVEFFLPASMGKAVWTSKIPKNEDVLLGIKPSDIKLGVCKDTDAINLQGEVVAVNPMESGTMVLAQIGDERICISTDSRPQLFCGQVISLAFSLGSAILIHGMTNEVIKEAIKTGGLL